MKAKPKTINILIILLIVILTVVFGIVEAEEDSAVYLGNTSQNVYDSDSVNNPYSDYSNPYSDTSLNNPYTPYTSPYSDSSSTSPYATDAPVMYGQPQD